MPAFGIYCLKGLFRLDFAVISDPTVGMGQLGVACMAKKA